MEENRKNESGLVVSSDQIITTILTDKSTDLVDLIMANIRKINEDPKNIPQADAVNSQVKTLIDLGKTQLETLKLAAFISQK